MRWSAPICTGLPPICKGRISVSMVEKIQTSGGGSPEWMTASGITVWRIQRQGWAQSGRPSYL